MNNLIIITHIDFWKHGAGHRARLSSIITFLKERINITVVFAGKFDDQDDITIKSKFTGITFEPLGRGKNLTFGEYKARFENYATDKNFHFALIEYIEMSFVLPYLNQDCITLLDTHDLVFKRMSSFQRGGLKYSGIELSENEEFEIFNCFDFIIVIQDSDYKEVNSKLEDHRILLIPHPSRFEKKTIRKNVKQIGFVASGYSPNVDSLIWFLQMVWPHIYDELGIMLNVYGDVCNCVPAELRANVNGVRYNGFVADLNVIYESCDILVNPVRVGAGLKIKNIEAIGNGLPLITTPHGAIGMEEGINCSFLVADSAEDFMNSIKKLNYDFQFRLKIADEAYSYAQKKFLPEQCYQPLLEVILKPLESKI